MKATDVQVGGNHYKQFKIQPNEFIHRNGLNFCQGNIIKYVCRHRFKNGKEDLKKAIHYAQILIEYENAGYRYPKKIQEISITDFCTANDLNQKYFNIFYDTLHDELDDVIKQIEQLIKEYPDAD